MTECRWLSVKEMMEHQSPILIWNAVRRKAPTALAEKLTVQPDGILETSNPRLQHTRGGLRWRTVELWNRLPTYTRNTLSLPSFKKQCKKWLLDQRTAGLQDPG